VTTGAGSSSRVTEQAGQDLCQRQLGRRPQSTPGVYPHPTEPRGRQRGDSGW